MLITEISYQKYFYQGVGFELNLTHRNACVFLFGTRKCISDDLGESKLESGMFVIDFIRGHTRSSQIIKSIHLELSQQELDL